jgi:hypothetical protein
MSQELRKNDLEQYFTGNANNKTSYGFFLHTIKKAAIDNVSFSLKKLYELEKNKRHEFTTIKQENLSD